ncbi:transmembrane receptor protein tyrosine kinase [Dorcoceras hygrometricum]|uniref:Transmembrane receptor protein tyrosine kinase n=1 Tax=Dorcoceras hygrometricum TaxID=472368 RepID=A0A2Z7C2B9_9LAMI|nr:transmembrane receptor protein tyrosine kinase [Dorcoceras hygrometricum]
MAGSYAQPNQRLISTTKLSRELNSRLGTDLITNGMKFYLYDTMHNQAATSRSSTSRSQPPKVVWNNRSLQEESNATSIVQDDGRNRWESPDKINGTNNQQTQRNQLLKSQTTLNKTTTHSLRHPISSHSNHHQLQATIANKSLAAGQPNAGSKYKSWNQLQHTKRSVATNQNGVALPRHQIWSSRAIPAASYVKPRRELQERLPTLTSGKQICASTGALAKTTTFPPRAIVMLTRIDICLDWTSSRHTRSDLTLTLHQNDVAPIYPNDTVSNAIQIHAKATADFYNATRSLQYDWRFSMQPAFTKIQLSPKTIFQI